MKLDGTTLNGRSLRISLPGDVEDKYNRQRDGDREDRTANDWRMGGRSALPPREREPRRDDFSRNGMRGAGFEDRDNGMRPYEAGNGRDRPRGDRPYGDRGGFNDFERRGPPPDRGFDRFDRDRDRDRGGFDRDRHERRDDHGGGFRDDRRGGYGEDRYGGPPRRVDDRYDRPPPRREFERAPPVERERHSSPPPPAVEREPPKERPKLQLKPRTLPIEDKNEPSSTSAIFGGAKPVDTAKKEQEIEAKLHAKEQAAVGAPGEESTERVRRYSANSSSSNPRSRKTSESSPRERDERPRNDRRRNFDRDFERGATEFRGGNRSMNDRRNPGRFNNRGGDRDRDSRRGEFGRFDGERGYRGGDRRDDRPRDNNRQRDSERGGRTNAETRQEEPPATVSCRCGYLGSLLTYRLLRLRRRISSACCLTKTPTATTWTMLMNESHLIC